MLIVFLGPVMETKASPTDHHENVTGFGPTSRENMYRQVSYYVMHVLKNITE